MTTDPALRGRPSIIQAVGLAVGAAAAFPASWWLLGRVDHSGEWITDPDYAVRPPQIDRGLAHAIGAGSTVLAAAALGILIAYLVRERWARCVAGVFVPLAAGFAYLGTAAHVATTPVIGANIGIGLVSMGSLPIGAALIAIAASSLRACS